MDYPIIIRQLNADGGGGYIAFAPDLKGCMSTGDSPQEVLAGIQDAIEEWLESWNEMGRQVPAPGSAARRAREEHERFSRKIAELEAATDDLDLRIEELRAEFREHLEALEAWDRFESIAGISAYSVDPGEQRQLGLQYEN